MAKKTKPQIKDDLRSVITGVTHDKNHAPIVNEFMANRVLKLVNKGLVHGLGNQEPGQMCVEAAVAYAYGEEHNDNPLCVASDLAGLKIELNDRGWSSEKARAKGLQRLAIAQLGSYKTFNSEKFRQLLIKECEKLLKDKITVAKRAVKKAETAFIKAVAVNTLTVKIPSSKFDINEDLVAVENWIEGKFSALYNQKIGSKLRKLSAKVTQAQSVYKTLNVESVLWEDKNLIEDVIFLVREHTSAKGDAVFKTVAEILVQVLIKMKIPGTKYLYLTEK